MSTPASPQETLDPTDILDTGEAGGKAIRGSVLRVIGYGVSAALGLASAPLLVRHLGVVEFGRYTTVLSLIALGAGITEAGLGAVALREYVGRSPADRAAFMRSVLGARIVLTALGVTGAFLFALVTGYDEVMLFGTAVAGVGLLVGVVQATLFVPFAAGLRLGWITFGDIARSVAVLALVVALVLGGSGIVGFLAITIPTNLALLALTMVLVRGMVPFRPSFRFDELRMLLRETLPLAIATAISTLYFRIAIIIMSLLATGLQTGYFATSYRITEVLGTIPVLLVATVFPILSRAARDDEKRLDYALQRIFEIAVIGGLAMTVLVVVGAPTAMAFIGGEEAEPATDVLRIQAVALPVLSLTITWGHGLLALHAHRQLLIGNTIALVTVVAFSLVLVPLFDAEGAALAVLVGESALAMSLAVLLRRRRGRLLQSARVVPRALLAAGLALAVGFLPGLALALQFTLAALVYLGVLVALRAIPSELRAVLLRR